VASTSIRWLVRHRAKRTPCWLSFDELEKVLKHVEPMWRPAMALAGFAGLRKGEVFGLRRGDVSGNQLTISRSWDRSVTKGGSTRVVPISSRLKPFVESLLLLPGRPEGRLVPADAKNIRLQKHLRAACRAAGIRGKETIRFHDLRVGFATELAKKGAPMHVVQRLLGHSTIELTNRVYVQVVGDDLVKTINAIVG